MAAGVLGLLTFLLQRLLQAAFKAYFMRLCGSCYSLRPPETVHQSGPESAVVSGELGAWAVGSEAVSHAGMPSIAMVQWTVHSLWLWRFLWQERCPHSWRSESSLSYISHTLGVQGAEGLGWLCSLRGLLSLF